MKVSVIIPSYGRPTWLQELLNALSKQSFSPLNFEVIIVDDASTNLEQKKQAILSVQYPFELKYEEQQKGGPAKARNKAISLATGEYILMTDDDALPDSNWISEMYTSLNDHKYAGVAGKTLGFQSTTAVSRYYDYVGHLWSHQFDANNNVIYIVTVNAGFRADILKEVNGFDEKFPFAAGEDIDLGVRILSKGHQFTYNPKAIVHHRHPRTIKGLIRTSFFYGRGCYYCAEKNTDTAVYGKVSSAMGKISDVASTLFGFFTSVYRNIRSTNVSGSDSFVLPLLHLIQYFCFHMGRIFELSIKRSSK